MTAPRVRRATSSSVLVFALALTAAACGSDNTDATPAPTPQATATASGATPTTGTLALGPGGDLSSLPKDYPKDQVPLVSGDILQAYGTETKSGPTWEVTIDAGDRAPAALTQQAIAQLEKSGFERGATGEEAGFSTTTLTKKGWSAVVIEMPKSGPLTAGVHYRVVDTGS